MVVYPKKVAILSAVVLVDVGSVLASVKIRSFLCGFGDQFCVV